MDIQYFENPRWRKLWVNSGQPSTSTEKSNHFGKKAMLCVWDQKGAVYYELFKFGEMLLVPTTNEYFEPCNDHKTSRMIPNTWKNDFATWQSVDPHHKNSLQT